MRFAWLLLVLVLGGCDESRPAQQASAPIVVVVPGQSPASPPAPQAPPQRAPAMPARPTPPPTFTRRQGRTRRRKRELTDRELARHAAARALSQAGPGPKPVVTVDGPTIVEAIGPPALPAPKPQPVKAPVSPPRLAAPPKPPPAPLDVAVQRSPADTRADTAESLASEVVANIERKREDYDRAVIRRFQSVAGLVVDGVYGPGTAGALRHFLGTRPPMHFLRTKVRERPYERPW